MSQLPLLYLSRADVEAGARDRLVGIAVALRGRDIRVLPGFSFVYVENRGAAIHHVCFQVDDTEEVVGDLSDDELRARQLFSLERKAEGGEKRKQPATQLSPSPDRPSRSARAARARDPWRTPGRGGCARA